MTETWNQISLRHRRRAWRGWILLVIAAAATVWLCLFGTARRGRGAEPLSLTHAILESTKTRGARADLPAGDMVVTEGLTIGNASGGVIEGKGVSELLAYAHPLTAASTRLIASGKERTGMTLVTASGAETVIRDLSLFGYTRNEHNRGAERAKCGVLITKTADGLATGGLTLDNLFIIGFKTGIQAAVGVTENNCERCSLRKVRFHNSDAGLVLKSQQSMGFGLADCEWWDVRDCIRVEGGGKLVVTNAFTHHPDNGKEHAFLRIAARDYEKSIGPNNGFYHVTGFYADQNAANLKLLAMRPVDDAGVRTAYYCSTVFDGFHISNESYTEPAIEVCGVSSTTLRDGYGVQKKSLTWDNDPEGPFAWTSRVVYENCACDFTDGRDVIDATRARGACHVTVKGCYYGANNSPVKDFDGVVMGELK